MKYFSMFSGIGGFELGIQQAYESIQELRNTNTGLRQPTAETGSSQGQPEQLSQLSMEGLSCVGYSEIDKYAIQIYERHFNHKNYGDATTINPEDLPDFNLLVGGFPCQAFSIAGKRKGLDDTRGTLFYDIARIAKEKRPQHLLLENVKGLLSHDNGRTFKLIISTFAELGYDLEWQVLNSKNFGVPQNRERVFIIGHLGRCCGRQVFPIGKNDSSIDQQSNKVLQKSEVASTVTATYWKGGKGSQIQVPEATKQGFAIAEEGDSINLSIPNSKTRRGRVGKGIAQTLDTGMQQHTLQNMRIRRLTPTECERLQGFPDGWTEGVSDTQRYKTLGNGVTVNVVEEIIKRLYGT